MYLSESTIGFSGVGRNHTVVGGKGGFRGCLVQLPSFTDEEDKVCCG